MHLITSNDVLKKDYQYISHTYNRFSIALKEGHGARAIDFDGKKYIDFGSGIGTNSLGFCNENWLKAIVAQAEKLQHTSNLFYTLPDVLLAERLCEITDYSKIFFGNSGAEANEGAIKIARKYGMETKGISCNQIITLRNSFHGRTITTLAATGQDVFHRYFDPFTDGFRYIPVNDSQAFDNALDETICAVMIELVQGEGGVIALSKEYVAYIAEVCKERDILLIVDEVQTGVGRTGTFLCCERYGIHPNIITLAKGLGAGLPIGAVLMDEKTENVFQSGHHGSTFGGNPVVCAGALEVLNQIADEDFLADICMKSEYIREKIAAFPHVKELSGIGLMLGITLSEEVYAADIAKRCAEQGLLILTAKNKLRMLPPLNITKDEIDTGIGILQNVLSEI